MGLKRKLPKIYFILPIRRTKTTYWGPLDVQRWIRRKRPVSLQKKPSKNGKKHPPRSALELFKISENYWNKIKKPSLERSLVKWENRFAKHEVTYKKRSTPVTFSSAKAGASMG